MVSEKKGSKMLNKLLEIKTQLKVYHWQTKLYSRHLAADKFLTKAEDIIDNIIEVYQGKYGVIDLNNKNKNVKIDNISNADITKYLMAIKKYLEEDYVKILNKNVNTDLLNLRDELLASINTTIYLFNQK